MKKSDARPATITSWQLFTLIVNSMIATGVFTIARTTGAVAGRGFLLAIPLAGLLALAQLVGMYLLSRRFPQQSLAEYAPLILGKWLGVAYLFGYFLVAVSLAVIIPRNFWLLVNAWIFRSTPHFALLLPLALVSWNMSRRGVVVLSRLSEIIFWLSLPALLITIVPHTTLEVENLLPVLDKGLPPVLMGIFPAYFSLIGFDIWLFIYPFCEQRRAFGVAAWAISLTSLFYTISAVLIVGTIGLELTLLNTWPLQQYLNHFSLTFVERIDVIILIVWTLQILAATAIPLFSAGCCLRGIFPRLNSRRAADLGLLLLLAGVLSPIRLPWQTRLAELYSYAALLFIGCSPFLLWLVALLRQKGVSPREQTLSDVA